MVLNKKRIVLISATTLALALVVFVSFIIFHKKPQAQTQTNVSDIYTISDASAGLTFNVSKDFTPISDSELKVMNPDFTYGFRPVSDPNAVCIVSKTKLIASGTVTPSALRDGILGTIKSIHTDVKLDSWSPAKFGDAQGVILQATYTDSGVKIKRVEIIALGQTTEVVAYCQSTSVDSSKYYNDFTTFFSSIRLK